MSEYRSVTEMIAADAAEYTGFEGDIRFIPISGHVDGVTTYEAGDVVIKLNSFRYGSLKNLESMEGFIETLYHELCHGIQKQLVQKKGYTVDETSPTSEMVSEAQSYFLTNTDSKKETDLKEFYGDILKNGFKLGEEVYTVSYEFKEIRFFGYSKEGKKKKEDVLKSVDQFPLEIFEKEAENFLEEEYSEEISEIIGQTHVRMVDTYWRAFSKGNQIPLEEEFLGTL